MHVEYSTEPATIYKTFKALPGSDYIASSFAIGELIKWVRKEKPRSVLEVGAGIGTLTFTLSSLKQEQPFELVSVEWNEFCMNSIATNLESQRRDFRFISKMDELENAQPFDLIVIDGGEQDPRFISHIAPRGVIFIEGFMDKKHTLIHGTHKHKRRYIWTNFRSSDRKSGIWIFRFEPTLLERVWFSYQDFVNRIHSAAKRIRIRSGVAISR